jgi:hypothetical protein
MTGVLQVMLAIRLVELVPLAATCDRHGEEEFDLGDRSKMLFSMHLDHPAPLAHDLVDFDFVRCGVLSNQIACSLSDSLNHTKAWIDRMVASGGNPAVETWLLQNRLPASTS